jgi:hypothetical protein
VSLPSVPLHLHRCTKCQGIDMTWGPDGLCDGTGRLADDCDYSHRGVFLCVRSAVDDLFCGGHYERIDPDNKRRSDPVFYDSTWHSPNPAGATRDSA